MEKGCFGLGLKNFFMFKNKSRKKIFFILLKYKIFFNVKKKILYFNRIKKILSKVLINSFYSSGFFCFEINIKFLTFLSFFFKKYTLIQCESLMDIVCVDFLKKYLLYRFELIYNFLSFKNNSRFFLKLKLKDLINIESLSNIYKSANWVEREIWDLFGICFFNHPDLRRILTDYGFEGFPLRKDFPLVGFLEIRFDDEKKCILYEPSSFSQEFRSFSFLNPWPQFEKNFNS